MKTAQLTITKATSQARRVVDKVMPGVMATVESRHGWDAAGDRQTVITTITFPAETLPVVRLALNFELYRLSGWWGSDMAPSRIAITRVVA